MPRKTSLVATFRQAAEWAVFLGYLLFTAAYGDAIWRATAPIWPGGGHGFAATAGFLTIVAWSVAGIAYRRARRAEPASGKAARLWGLSAGACAVATPCTAALVSLVPGRNGQPLGSVFQDGPMWIEGRPGVYWAILPGLLAGAALLATPRGSGRRRRQQGVTDDGAT